MRLATVILAAGEGTRMKSSLPKVLHQLAGRPMLAYVLDACRRLEPERQLVVVGHKFELVLASLDDGVQPVHQHEQLGTGHAVLITEPLLGDFDGPVLVLAGDIPLIRPETLRALVGKFNERQVAAVLVTAELDNPSGYGRVLRGEGGAVESIVEEKDAGESERAVKEINAGIYCFDRRRLFGALASIKNKNRQSEYYLTDVVAILRKQGETVLALGAEPDEVLGVNSRAELAGAESLMQRRLKKKMMDDGVTFILPETTFISADVDIGNDSVVLPGCFLEAGTRIGKGCRIGPGARIIESTIGSEVDIQYSVLRGCRIEDKAAVGPFCSLRPGTVLGKGAKAGTFVEIKQSSLGPASKVPHLSYIGDAEIGRDVNIGAGSITCNYDGVKKHRTVIEDGAFIGSDTMLVAPVVVGRGAVTGAGSSITVDVPPESLAVERADQKIISGWAKKRRKHKS